jgi:hypothetical protein
MAQADDEAAALSSTNRAAGETSLEFEPQEWTAPFPLCCFAIARLSCEPSCPARAAPARPTTHPAADRSSSGGPAAVDTQLGYAALHQTAPPVARSGVHLDGTFPHLDADSIARLSSSSRRHGRHPSPSIASQSPTSPASPRVPPVGRLGPGSTES